MNRIKNAFNELVCIFSLYFDLPHIESWKAQRDKIHRDRRKEKKEKRRKNQEGDKKSIAMGKNVKGEKEGSPFVRRSIQPRLQSF